MRKLFLIAGIAASSLSFAQGSTFLLSDSVFTPGGVYASCAIQYDFHSPILGDESGYPPCVDSIADLMIRHPEITWEIGSHTDQRGSDTSNIVLSQKRANSLKKYLTEHGVSEFSIVAIGYGESQPVNNPDKINAAKTKEEKEILHQQNRRTEFTILHIYKKHFTLTDSVFEEGDLMRCPVYFDFNKPTIRVESRPLLDSIARFLIAHPNLIVEINNHRDTRGSDVYSTDITKTRSRSVAEYLIAQGVPQQQVMYKGYGETMPLVSETYINSIKSKEGQEQLHQVNRRTEIRINAVN